MPKDADWSDPTAGEESQDQYRCDSRMANTIPDCPSPNDRPSRTAISLKLRSRKAAVTPEVRDGNGLAQLGTMIGAVVQLPLHTQLCG
jgi:hypothetical protein